MSPVKCEIIDVYPILEVPGATRTETIPWTIPEDRDKPLQIDFPRSRRPFSLSVFGSGGLWELTKDSQGEEKKNWKTLPNGYLISYRVCHRTVNLTYTPPETTPININK